ncbi:hypothetical protein EFBL_0704 [Effusibacillus lacus]|uniref:Peptidase S8/S53 domain-containing protein n=1 Tax=Effusibacillus lacus TaxID=1348429 RepID=A0A292YKV6_9BACL|nr:hypothetical protein EFBL_0704 [Effusibacillus lacus]
MSIFLQIDPRELPVEDLRKYGIEVIGEFEDGFVIGSSSDLTLVTLKEKIEKFAAGAQHQVAGLWDIVTGVAWRREKILSEALLRDWPIIKDYDQMVVEIGIACLGTEEVPVHPKNRRSSYKSEVAYNRAVETWTKKRNEIYDMWDELMNQRYDQLLRIIRSYQGEVISGPVHENPELLSSMPDSFTVKVRISGKGFKDIVENHPYVFDISEVDGIEKHEPVEIDQDETINEGLIFNSPSEDAPAVCIIDSGIQERHIYLKEAIDQTVSRSWINSPTDVADHYPGGHGTRVAGAVLYPRDIPRSGQVHHNIWIQNARVLDNNNGMPSSLFQPILMRQIVEYFHSSPRRTKIFNHSINSTNPCRVVHMSAWAAAIDQLSWEKDVLFVISAGNLPLYSRGRPVIRLAIADHMNSGRNYPDYLLEPSSRIANPAQSLQAITVGSIGLADITSPYYSFSKTSEPSAYSCTGPGIFQTIKPEVVEYGGCVAHDGGTPRRILNRPELSPQLIRSNLYGGSAVGRDQVGTSFAAPKVSHILAGIQRVFPDESTLLYRALLIQSARWPDWTSRWPDPTSVLRHIGYGVPDLKRATENNPYRITLITQGEVRISGKQVHIYEVRIPEELRRLGDAFDIRIDITLSYKAQPRRTRRNRQRYLSTWLEWQTSERYESMESFVSKMIELASGDEYIDEVVDESRESIKWMIHKRSDWGRIKGFRRDDNTVQKDWAYLKSYEWREAFYIAVIGHLGWNRDMNATVPYALAVSFEAINEDVEIYQPIAIENEINIKVEI